MNVHEEEPEYSHKFRYFFYFIIIFFCHDWLALLTRFEIRGGNTLWGLVNFKEKKTDKARLIIFRIYRKNDEQI